MTTSIVSDVQIQAFLAETSPFDRLSEKALKAVVQKSQLLSYRQGQPILSGKKFRLKLQSSTKDKPGY
jgi:subfamily B ATP-binding cassette protein HlyB/CyaB